MLAALEIVLGIDNIIFISILVGRLPAKNRDSDFVAVGIPRAADDIDDREAVGLSLRCKNIHQQARAVDFTEDDILALGVGQVVLRLRDRREQKQRDEEGKDGRGSHQCEDVVKVDDESRVKISVSIVEVVPGSARHAVGFRRSYKPERCRRNHGWTRIHTDGVEAGRRWVREARPIV